MSNSGATPEQRVLIDACIANGVPFFWQSPGTLLVARSGLHAVLNTVIAEGAEVLGLEGFDMNSTVQPRLDLVFDAQRRPGVSAIEATDEWPDETWVDVVVQLPESS